MSKQSTNRFITAFFLSFCLLLLPYLLTLFTFNGDNRASMRNPAPASEPVEGEDFAIFTALMSDSKTLSGLFVVHFSPNNNEITLCNIPLQLQLDYNGSLWRMDELTSSIGNKGLIAVLGQILQLDDPRYAMFNIDGMVKLVDSIGRIEYQLPLPIYTQTGVLTLEAGPQQLDGRRISLILASPDYSNASALGVERTANLYKQGISYRLPHLNEASLELVFSLTANNAMNNLSYQDFHQLKPSIQPLISPDTKVTVFALDGKYIGDRGSFIPTKESLDKLKQLTSVA